MRRNYLALALLTVTYLAAWAYDKKAFAQSGDSVFQLTSGYFQSTSDTGGVDEPVHLTHDGAKLYADLGGSYTIWLSFKLPKDAVSPCPRSQEEQCFVIQQIVRKDKKGNDVYLSGWKKGMAERIDPGVEWGIASEVQSVKRSIPAGDAFLVVKIVTKDKEVFRREFPLDIR